MKVKTTVAKRGGAAEVARRVGVTTWTVYKWIKEDRLPPYAAEILQVSPRGKFKRPPCRGAFFGVKPAPVPRSWWQRLIDWMVG